MQDLLFDDVLAFLNSKPRLLNDLIDNLRSPWKRADGSSRYWKINAEGFEDSLRELGFYFARRPHGAGVAIYVSETPFVEVVDGRGKTRAVLPC